MESGKTLLDGIQQDIHDILYRYVQAQSFTCSAREKEAEGFVMDLLSRIPYFQEHKEYMGAYPIDGDPFDRAVCYGMVKGTGKETVVLIHHNDVVDIEDFKLLKSYAFMPDELGEELLKIKDSLPADAREDLEDGTFLFGRGTADMKGGGSIQLALLERYSRMSSIKGNVIVLALPDEENLSAGMRAGVKLLAELQDKYGLDYKMMINSEPHQRKDFARGLFSEGSVGKIMPFIYVRGYLSHIGKVFEGLNPLNLMCEIMRRTELNMSFADAVEGECAPPPTWLYLKDSKTRYDVSMPLSASGCFSILTLNQTPGEVMEKVREICDGAFEKVLEEMGKSYEAFNKVTGQPQSELPWKKEVLDFDELYQQALAAYGDAFRNAFEKKRVFLSEKLKEGSVTILESNFELVEFIFNYIDDLSPKVVYGLVPPYYPNVSNLYVEGMDDRISTLSIDLDRYINDKYGQHYDREYFYTGISDLSYSSIKNGNETLKALNRSMPFFADFYDIPVDAIEKISMPCINIGPWGKDFHKLTERVLKEDLYVRTPDIINKALSMIFDQPEMAE